MKPWQGLFTPSTARHFAGARRATGAALHRAQSASTRRRFTLVTKSLVAVVLATASTSAALAHGYPEHPVTMLVPSATSTPTDKLARVVARQMGKILGTKVQVKNLGATDVGARSVAHAAPDGYTIAVARRNTRAVDGKLYQLPYGANAGVEALGVIADDPQLIVTNTAVPARDLGELIAWVRQNQSTISMAVTGNGSSAHMGAIFFVNRIGTPLHLVPYRDDRSATRALAAGQMDLMLIQASSALTGLRAGTIKAYAVTARSRLASAPDIPTVDEAGLPGFYAATSQVIWAPRATAADVVAKLRASVVQALLDPDVRRQMSDLGQEAPAIAALDNTDDAQATGDAATVRDNSLPRAIASN